MLSTDMNNLKYVAVEIIKNPGTKLIDVECGAFMGIVVHKNEANMITTFVVLQNTDSSIRMYNTSDYGVMTIQAETPDMKYMTVFTKNDQVEAIDMLKQVVSIMKSEKRLYSTTPGNELINVDSYIDIPPAVFIGNNLSSAIADNTSTKPHTTDITNTYNTAARTTHTTGYTPYTPEKPSVLSFKRKGKLPTEEKLSKMRELVEAITDNTIKFTLPIPKHDMPKKEQTDNPTEDHSQETNNVTM